MELILFAVPPVVTAVMFIAKKLAGFAAFDNGAAGRTFLRFMLVLFSLVGIVSTSLLTGKAIDADSVSNLVTIALETIVSAYGSHWLYVILTFFRNYKDWL